jgi:hypothetical protein
MFLKVEEDVRDRTTDLAGSTESVSVVAARPNATVATSRRVDGPGAADREPQHSATEGVWRIAFDDQVDVINLHGEMNHSERRRRRRRERTQQVLEGGA